MTESAQTAEYPLYFRDGAMRMYWSLDTCGIALSPSGLAFTGESGRREVPFSQVRSIRLHTTFADSGGTPIGICQIGFRDGRALTVYSGNARGLFDDGQRAHYVAFVRDLHRRIPAAERTRIAFHGGLTDTRYAVVTAAVVAGAFLFVALPLALLLIVPSWQTFGVAFAAGGLAYAGWRTFDRNRPISYAPDRIPEELLP